MDDWDWNELESPPFKGTTSPIQLPTELLPPKNQGAGGGIRQDDYPDQVDTLDWEALEHPPDRNTKPKLDNTSRPPLNPACEQRQAQWLLCQDTCGFKNSMPNLSGKTRIIQDYGLRTGKADLISNTPHPSGDHYKTGLHGKARDNMRNIRVANDTKMLSYNSPRSKQDRRTISKMDLTRTKRTWPQF